MQSHAEVQRVYDSVVVAPSFMQRMITHAQSNLPLECCGVLGGRGAVVTSVYPVENAAQSESRYFCEPSVLFNAVRKMREKGEEMIGIYHSHPNSAPEPSETDRSENEYPGLFYFIISLNEDKPQVRCYKMSDDREFERIQIV